MNPISRQNFIVKSSTESWGWRQLLCIEHENALIHKWRIFYVAGMFLLACYFHFRLVGIQLKNKERLCLQLVEIGYCNFGSYLEVHLLLINVLLLLLVHLTLIFWCCPPSLFTDLCTLDAANAQHEWYKLLLWICRRACKIRVIRFGCYHEWIN